MNRPPPSHGNFASIHVDELGAVNSDIRSTMNAIDDELLQFRRRFDDLGVPVGPLDRLAEVSRVLREEVLPDLELRHERAVDLESGRTVPGMASLHDVASSPFVTPNTAPTAPAPPSAPGYTLTSDDTGQTQLSWPAQPEVEEAEQEEEDSGFSLSSVGGWFSDRADDVGDAVSAGADWAGDRVDDAMSWVDEQWDNLTAWWDRWTADVGAWIDEHLAGLREWIGEHAGLLRVIATVLKVVGWILVVVGVLLAIAGAWFFGIGAAPGLMVAGIGLSVVGAGDFVDTAVDWGEGKIDGQELLNQSLLNLGITALSWVGVGAIARVAKQLLKHLPPSWVDKLDELFHGRRPRPATPRPGDPSLHDPLRSGDPSGPGWQRLPDGDVRADYGQPRHPHGTLDPDYRPRDYDDLDPAMRDLIDDPDAPYGRLPDGRPMTLDEFNERYMTEAGRPDYPDNAGAVPGTRVQFDNFDDFATTYGDEFDRIGGEGGEYLGVPPGASFESRALPPGSVNNDIHNYQLVDPLPAGFRIEVSEVAPAFGREGGGVQVQIFDDRNPDALSVRDLIDRGILRR